MPHPPTSREKIQNQEIRDHELDPDVYYPKGYKPELLPNWPVEGDLVVPIEQLPESLKQSMGDRWRTRVKNNEALEEQER